MKVLLTRSVENNARTATRLIALGHQPICLALSEAVDIAPEKIEFEQAIIFTSSAAVEVLSRRGIKGDKNSVVFCVGERTRQEAQNLGFEKFPLVADSACELARDIKEHYLEQSAKITYFAGRNRSFDFTKAFAGTEIILELIESYEIKRLLPNRDLVMTALESAKNGVQLHFSALSAQFFFELVKKYNLESVCGTMDAVSISQKTSHAVDKSLVKSVQNAKIANETGMMAVLD